MLVVNILFSAYNNYSYKSSEPLVLSPRISLIDQQQIIIALDEEKQFYLRK